MTNCLFIWVSENKSQCLCHCINYIAFSHCLSNDSFRTTPLFFAPSYPEQVFGNTITNRLHIFYINIFFYIYFWSFFIIHKISSSHIKFNAHNQTDLFEFRIKIFTSLLPDIPLIYTFSTILLFFFLLFVFCYYLPKQNEPK